MPLAKLNGININYKVEGQGEPLVMIMGFTANRSSWTSQIPCFKKYFRLVTFDNRGVGKSDKPQGPYSTKMMADDAVRLMDLLGIEKAHILGVSMGGMIAQELAQHCRKVYIIHRRDQLRATKALQEKVFSQPKIELVWNSVVDEIAGDKMLKNLRLRNVKTGQSSDLEVDGIFVAVGLKPNSQAFSKLVTLDEVGFIVTDEMMRTSVPGIFAAGDVRHNSFRQVITAAGDGAAAAMSAFKYVKE